MRLWLGTLVLVTACAPSREPCTAEDLAPVEALYTAAALHAIDEGACDKYETKEECPAFSAVKKSFELAQEAVCR